MNSEFNLEKIKNSSNHDVKIKELIKFLQYYFHNGRPKKFVNYVDELIEFIPGIMNKMSFEELFYIIPNYYQFWYTVTIEDNFIVNQDKINKNLLHPFSKSLQNFLDKSNYKPLSYEINENHYVIICRHAVTRGMYAPGSVIFSITSELLKQGKKVLVLTLGEVDKKFIELKKTYSNLNFLKKNIDSTALKLFLNLRKICVNFRPYKIITEMPINIPTALYYSKVSSKFLYWSPGFTKVPWFDKVLLVPELVDKKLLKNKKFVEVPRSLSFELLNPTVNLKLVENFKNNNFIKKTNFVMGTFARYELISKTFLKLVYDLLEGNKNRKIVIAGSNDNVSAKNVLHKFVENKQAIILGFSDVHILGNCCDVFLDTIPYPCGSAAIEIMAKGKPVLSFDQPNLANYKKSRIPELIAQNQIELELILKKLENNVNFYNEMSKKSKAIAKAYDNGNELVKLIITM